MLWLMQNLGGMSPRISHFSSLDLGFLTYKVGTIIIVLACKIQEA